MTEIYTSNTPTTANIKYPKPVQALVDQMKIAELEFAERDSFLANPRENLLFIDLYSLIQLWNPLHPLQD